MANVSISINEASFINLGLGNLIVALFSQQTVELLNFKKLIFYFFQFAVILANTDTTEHK